MWPKYYLVKRFYFSSEVDACPFLFINKVQLFLQVTEGERLTLTLWFTRDSAYDEDPKLLSFLSQTSLNYEPVHQSSYIPLPASDIMYWFAYDHSGFDVRCARVHILGFSFHSSIDEDNKSVAPAEDDPIELLGKPVRLGRGDDVFDKVFANGLHALQVSTYFHFLSSFSLQIMSIRLQ